MFTQEDLQQIKAAYKALDDKFGKDIVALDISGVSTVADCFVIATGSSPAQIRAMCDEVALQLEQQGLRLNHVEGQRTMNWVLMDFGSIIIHIFDKENRGFYNLERIWSDARDITRDFASESKA